jgi:hypothetical protein
VAERPRFQQVQYAFAAHIRDPGHAPRPADVDDRRMGVYRELFFNNINGFLADTLPVLHRILPESDWTALVRDFMIRHRAHSPYFLDIPREFLRYLDERRGEQPQDPPFLRELAHYEWVELALSVHAAALDTDDLDRAGDPLAGHPVLSPLAWPLSYRYPVHRIGPDHQPDTPPAQATHLLVYRDAADEVRFLELNPVSARLIGLLTEHADDPAYTGRQALETIAAELQHPQPEQVFAGGRQILEDWRARGIVLGTAPATP